MDLMGSVNWPEKKTRGRQKSRDVQKPVGLPELSAGNWDSNSVWPEPWAGYGGRWDGRGSSPHHDGLERRAEACLGNREPWKLLSEADLSEWPYAWPGWRVD